MTTATPPASVTLTPEEVALDRKAHLTGRLLTAKDIGSRWNRRSLNSRMLRATSLPERMRSLAGVKQAKWRMSVTLQCA